VLLELKQYPSGFLLDNRQCQPVACNPSEDERPHLQPCLTKPDHPMTAPESRPLGSQSCSNRAADVASTPGKPAALPRITRMLTLWPLLGLMVGSTGCLSRPAVVRQTFAFPSPAPRTTASEKGTRVLASRSFDISPLFASQSFVYRLGAEAYERDPYAGFIVPPDRALEIPVRAYLRNSGVFRDVAEPGSLLRPDCHLEVDVSELYGDVRTPAKPVAVLSMRFVLFNLTLPKDLPLSPTNIIRGASTVRHTAPSIVAGWSQALAEIMAELTADLLKETSRGRER
jgi:hypothetical protein